MKIKRNKRKALVITLSALVVAAAIAIPIGIVYGVTSDTKTQQLPSTINITKKESLATKYQFGTDPSSIPIPVLSPDGYEANPADYELGTIKGTTVDSKTIAGDNAATVTFTYKPKVGNILPTFYITYPLSTIKGTPTVGFGINNSGQDTESVDIQYGTVGFAQVENFFEGGIASWQSKKRYSAYVLKPETATEKNPRYTKADETTPFEQSELPTLPANQTFKAIYEFDFNKEQYESVQINGAEIAQKGKLTVTYKIVRKQLDAVNDKAAPEEMSIPYGTDFAWPTTDSSAAEPNYVLVSSTPQSVVTISPNGATKTPAKGGAVEADKVKEYEAGTSFTVV